MLVVANILNCYAVTAVNLRTILHHFLALSLGEGIIKKQKLNVLTLPKVGTVLRPRP